MTKCKECTKDFRSKEKNQIFCSRKCSATHNNSMRSVASPKNCLFCHISLEGDKRKSKFCSRKCVSASRKEERVKAVEGDRAGIVQIKRYLVESDNSCKICNSPSTWQGQKLVMIIDHIDGNSENNTLSNLRLVCPNCDSQLPTFKSRNKNSGRHYRRSRYSEGKSY